MRRKCSVFGIAAICAFALIVVFLFRFFPARISGPRSAKGHPVETASPVAPGRLITRGARAPMVPLAFNSPLRPASAPGQRKTPASADAAHNQFARWVELF